MAKKEMISIKDIAEKAGVSVSTVSRVMNTPEKVNPQMRKRVEEAIAQTNYRPNPSAQIIRRHRSGLYGILLPHYRTESFTKILSGAIDEAASSGHNLILSTPYDNSEEEIASINSLIDKPVDGLLYLPRSTGYAIPSIDYFKNIPIVGIARRHISFSAPCIYHDTFKSGYLATQYLLRLGRRHLAFVAAVQPNSGIRTVQDLERFSQDSQAGSYPAIDRWNGYRQALTEAEIPYQSSHVIIGEFSLNGGFESGQRILSIPAPIDGIIAGSDMTAMGILSVLKQQGIHVPEDISVIGCNDDNLSALCSPSLSTVRHDSYELGRRAIKMLNAMLSGEAVEDDIIDVTLTVRNSTIAKDPTL